MDTLINTLKGKKLIAIEGEPASGKTTLADYIEDKLEANVIHIDDFYKPLALRDAHSFEKGGNNIHFDCLIKDVIEKHLQKQTIIYQPYDCQTNTYGSTTKKTYKPLLILEGSYSLHQRIQPYFDYKILLEVSNPLQLERLQERKNFADFKTRWIPLSRMFIKENNIEGIVDLKVKNLKF